VALVVSSMESTQVRLQERVCREERMCCLAPSGTVRGRLDRLVPTSVAENGQFSVAKEHTHHPSGQCSLRSSSCSGSLCAMGCGVGACVNSLSARDRVWHPKGRSRVDVGDWRKKIFVINERHVTETRVGHSHAHAQARTHAGSAWA